jgi:hypothetical protein
MFVLNLVLASNENGWSGLAPNTTENVSDVVIGFILKMLKAKLFAGVISQAASVESVVSYFPATEIVRSV